MAGATEPGQEAAIRSFAEVGGIVSELEGVAKVRNFNVRCSC